MPGLRTRRCRSRTTSSNVESGPPARVKAGGGGHSGRRRALRVTAQRRRCHGGLYRASLGAGRDDGLGDFRPVVHDHPPASGRLRDFVHRLDVGVGQRGFRRRGAGAARAARSRQADHRAVREVDGPHPAGQFRDGDGMGTPRFRRHRRPSDADHGHFGGGDHIHLGHRVADRHLLRGLSLFVPRLRVHVHRLHRARDSRVPAGARRHVRRLRVLRRERRRPLFARFHRSAVEHGEGVGPHQAPADSRPSSWALREPPS